MSDFDPAIDAEEEVLTSYTSSTPAASTNRPAIKAPGGGTGRRKEAVARVRLTPGSGKWIVNGKALDVYFPNKVHQQLVSEPFRTVGAENQYDVIARINGGGTSRGPAPGDFGSLSFRHRQPPAAQRRSPHPPQCR